MEEPISTLGNPCIDHFFLSSLSILVPSRICFTSVGILFVLFRLARVVAYSKDKECCPSPCIAPLIFLFEIQNAPRHPGSPSLTLLSLAPPSFSHPPSSLLSPLSFLFFPCPRSLILFNINPSFLELQHGHSDTSKSNTRWLPGHGYNSKKQGLCLARPFSVPHRGVSRD